MSILEASVGRSWDLLSHFDPFNCFGNALARAFKTVWRVISL